MTIMSEVDILFGFHGAAFVNIMFMRPFSGFLEIFSPVARIGYYENMAKRVQLFYTPITKSKVDRSKPLPKDGRNHNLFVNIPNFVDEYEVIAKKVWGKKYTYV